MNPRRERPLSHFLQASKHSQPSSSYSCQPGIEKCRSRFLTSSSSRMSNLCFPVRSTHPCPRAGSKAASSISRGDNGLPMRSHGCVTSFSHRDLPVLSPARVPYSVRMRNLPAASCSTHTCPRAGCKLPSSISRVDNGLPVRSHGYAAPLSHAARAALAPGPPPVRGPRARECVTYLPPLCRRPRAPVQAASCRAPSPGGTTASQCDRAGTRPP